MLSLCRCLFFSFSITFLFSYLFCFSFHFLLSPLSIALHLLLFPLSLCCLPDCSSLKPANSPQGITPVLPHFPCATLSPHPLPICPNTHTHPCNRYPPDVLAMNAMETLTKSSPPGNSPTSMRKGSYILSSMPSKAMAKVAREGQYCWRAALWKIIPRAA